MKLRYQGRVREGHYEVLNPEGGVELMIPIEEARQDTKLAAAIRRNGWEPIDG